MKTERHFWSRSRYWMFVASVLLLGGTLVACSEYDLDERTPEGWGASIYSWLAEQGQSGGSQGETFTNTVRLIDDLGYREVLAKTGSKTLFVADDDAYERFYRNNPWGVRRYEDLSTSQKKLLLFGSMIDNSMQLNSLSSVEGTPPREGECMRRLAASQPYDSVPVLRPQDMPQNPYWNRYREAGRSLVCMEDFSVVPLVHFIEKQLTNKRISNEDYDFIYNNTTHRQPGEASVNGVEVVQANIKCSNGFIHRMSEVITPLPNMAELIASKKNVSLFNRLLERYCAPYPLDESVRTQYNYLYDTNVDSVFQKRFFSRKSQNGQPVSVTPDNGPVNGLLKYDPEWNSYYSGLNDQDGNIVLQRDMAVMMVPSDEALTEYWERGAGRVLKDYYGTWERVPDDVISKLINNNMLSSFVSSVPSKFQNILNDANDPMGVVPEAIDSVWLGCNGAVYLTNRVYSPTAYVSVSFPALVNETMKIMYWGIERLQYDVYLNSLNSYYSFFIPTNDALLEYIDPCSYGKTQTQLFRFHYDASKVNEVDRVWASIWNYDTSTKEVGDSIGKASTDQIQNRLKDILDTHIVIGDVEDGHTFYRTKGGTEIRVTNVSQGANGMTVEGSYQMNESEPLPVTYIYDQTQGGNGKSYILGSPILGTRNTVRDVLASHPEFSKFLELMDGSGMFEQIHNKRNACGGTNISTFNTYHYTIYVPSNESIEALQKKGQLSSWEAVEAFEEVGNLTAKTRDSLQIVNFLKYHIQDNALFIGAEEESGDFETAVIDPTTERFYRIKATLTDDGISLVDHAGNTRHVEKYNGLYNLVAREWQYNSQDASTAGAIETSSSAVIHLINEPLLLSK
ncbi:MAG: fasciclin domain-containing protein [Prevotella sp.]|nr:fasciclin domain-containing protein [Prevotella sp.]